MPPRKTNPNSANNNNNNNNLTTRKRSKESHTANQATIGGQSIPAVTSATETLLLLSKLSLRNSTSAAENRELAPADMTNHLNRDEIEQALKGFEGAQSILLPNSSGNSSSTINPKDYCLNDNVINVYFQSISAISDGKVTYINPKYLTEDVEKNLDRKNNEYYQDLLKASVIFWPFCINEHWGLLIFTLDTKNKNLGLFSDICVLDGLNSNFNTHPLVKKAVQCLVKKIAMQISVHLIYDSENQYKAFQEHPVDGDMKCAFSAISTLFKLRKIFFFKQDLDSLRNMAIAGLTIKNACLPRIPNMDDFNRYSNGIKDGSIRGGNLEIANIARIISCKFIIRSRETYEISAKHGDDDFKDVLYLFLNKDAQYSVPLEVLYPIPTIEQIKVIKEQTNTYDCGAVICNYAHYITMQAMGKNTVNPDAFDYPTFRLEIAYEISKFHTTVNNTSGAEHIDDDDDDVEVIDNSAKRTKMSV
jgi:hypothetical protein